MLYLRSESLSLRQRVRRIKTDQICFEKRTSWVEVAQVERCIGAFLYLNSALRVSLVVGVTSLRVAQRTYRPVWGSIEEKFGPVNPTYCNVWNLDWFENPEGKWIECSRCL